MSTKMAEKDWAAALEVFRAPSPRRGDKGRDDRLFPEVMRYFSAHNVSWRVLPEPLGTWNSVWKRFDRLSKAGVFETFFDHLASLSAAAHLARMFDSTIAFDLTGGGKGDAPRFPILLGPGPSVGPRAAVGDKGYASKANRQAARERGIIPAVPHKAEEKQKPGFFAEALYRGRARIEQAVDELERFKRVALRCERTKRNSASIVAPAAGFILVESVHTA